MVLLSFSPRGCAVLCVVVPISATGKPYSTTVFRPSSLPFFGDGAGSSGRCHMCLPRFSSQHCPRCSGSDQLHQGALHVSASAFLHLSLRSVSAAAMSVGRPIHGGHSLMPDTASVLRQLSPSCVRPAASPGRWCLRLPRCNLFAAKHILRASRAVFAGHISLATRRRKISPEAALGQVEACRSRKRNPRHPALKRYNGAPAPVSTLAAGVCRSGADSHPSLNAGGQDASMDAAAVGRPTWSSRFRRSEW